MEETLLQGKRNLCKGSKQSLQEPRRMFLVSGEQLLTLSTCDYVYNNGRFVVVAKEVS